MTKDRRPDALPMDKVEQLRVYLGLSVLHMAKLVGVSRQTYWNWQTAGIIGPRSVGKVRLFATQVRPLLANQQWPKGGAHLPDSRSRFDRLIEYTAIGG